MITTSREYFPALKARMAAAGVSQTALAAALGHRSSALVCRWLGGTVKATAETLARVELAFVGLVGPEKALGIAYATEGLSEPTPPGIGAPGGAGEATEPLFGDDIRWESVGRVTRATVLEIWPPHPPNIWPIHSPATPPTPPPSGPPE